MTPGLVVDDGNVLSLELLITAGIVVHLYTNRRIPSPPDRARDYEDLVLLGYSPVHLDGSLARWAIAPGDRAGMPAVAAYQSEVEWKFNGYGPTVMGYFLTIRDRLYGVVPFAKPVEIVNRGDVIAVIPILQAGLKAGA